MCCCLIKCARYSFSIFKKYCSALQKCKYALFAKWLQNVCHLVDRHGESYKFTSTKGIEMFLLTSSTNLFNVIVLLINSHIFVYISHYGKLATIFKPKSHQSVKH